MANRRSGHSIEIGYLGQRTEAIVAQKRLAEDVTTWVHGVEETQRAVAAARAMFSGGSLEDADLSSMPSSEIARAELDAGIPIVDLLARVGLAASKSAARRLVEQGGVYVNNQRATERPITTADAGTRSQASSSPRRQKAGTALAT